MEEENNIQVEPRESLKLIKNTKGYNWEVKILNTKGQEINDLDVRRLDFLNELMKEKFGDKNGE